MDYMIDDPKDSELGPRYSWFCQQSDTERHMYCGGYQCDCDCHGEEIIDG